MYMKFHSNQSLYTEFSLHFVLFLWGTSQNHGFSVPEP